jgi:hypothetical protein
LTMRIAIPCLYSGIAILMDKSYLIEI